MSASTEKKLRREAREAGNDKKALAAQAAAEKKAKNNRRWTLVGAGVAVLVIVALLLGSGLPYMSTAYTVGNEKFSAAEVNYHYGSQYGNFVNQYGSYASLFGLDTSNGPVNLEEQECYMTDGGSWKDYFLDSAKMAMVQTVALTDYAAENGIALTEDEMAGVESYFAGIDQAAVAYGFSTADQFFSANYGAGVDEDLVREGYMSSALCGKVIDEMNASFTYSDAEIEEKYQSYEGEQDMFEYMYYFVAAETSDETSEVSEEALKAAEEKAADIVKAFADAEGEDLEAKFNDAILSVDVNGFATEQRSTGASIIAAKEWLMDAARSEGDITSEVNSSESGYYVMLFVERDDNHYNMANVRHILVKAEADENGAYTDEAKAAAKARAEEILKEFESGDKSEESFAALAELYTEDTASAADGGLYENIAKGQMVEEFDAFCFEGHKKGDTAVVYGESSSYAGYHVMYYVGEGQQYSDYIAELDMRNADTTEWLNELTAKYETKEGFGMRLVG
ncbi:MAG: peptidylprolyl isomerase [Oscillospiraceae bacterium]|nr:peptidylprolyl isomerase [Oscillospiraceae bacterium]